MAVNLQKGQKVSLKKSDGKKLSRLMVGLGWDAAEQKRSGFFGKVFGGTKSIDCDASVFVCQGGKFVDKKDLVYFGNLEHPSGAIKHMGDNLTGEGEGDDEEIFVDLDRLPEQYDKLIFVVNIFQFFSHDQHFGMIKNAFIRIVDRDSNQEICRFNLSENYDNMRAVIAGEVYRYKGEWKFNAIGSGTTDKGLDELGARFS